MAAVLCFFWFHGGHVVIVCYVLSLLLSNGKLLSLLTDPDFACVSLKLVYQCEDVIFNIPCLPGDTS